MHPACAGQKTQDQCGVWRGSVMVVQRRFVIAVALVIAPFLSGCAVGPDFKAPAAPDADRYTAEPIATRTSATDVAQGEAQRFLRGRDIPAEWWTLFRSPA